MKRSPGPTPSSPLTIISAASAPGELERDPPRHPLGQRVARALHAGQVDEHELPVRAVRDAADRAARRLRPVGDDRHLGADDRVGQRRLADVGPAREGDEAGARSPSSRAARAGSASISPSSVSWSMPSRCRTPWTTASRRSVVCSGADHDVAELARAGGWRRRRRSGTRARRSARRARGARG